MSKFAFHPKCRPPRGACGPDDGGDFENGVLHPKPFMLKDNGRWVRDDGKTPAVAFIGSLDSDNIVWVANCGCIGACPRLKALEHARESLNLDSVSVVERPRKGGTRR